MTTLEQTTKLLRCLESLDEAYSTGDFSRFVTCLAEDCSYESMWVLEALHGREAISNYLLEKGKTIQEHDAYPDCQTVEVIGRAPLIANIKGEAKHATIHLVHDLATYCLLVEQEIDNKTNSVLVNLQMDEEYRINRINLLMPELFQTRTLGGWVDLYPARDANAVEVNYDVGVGIGEPYYSELDVFFCAAGYKFDEYQEEMVIPMGDWKAILRNWEEFAFAANYDAVVEKLCGIDYTTWSVSNKTARDFLRWNGASLWKDREINAVMLRGLQEWTQKYQDKYNFVVVYGY